MNSQDLHQQLMEAFRTEANERIESMFANLTALEKSTKPENQQKLLEVVYREAHSLKGAARSVNIQPVETLCQSMEEIFSQIKDKKRSFSPELFDILHLSAKTVEDFLLAAESEQIAVKDKIDGLIQSLIEFKKAPFEEISTDHTHQDVRIASVPDKPDSESGPKYPPQPDRVEVPKKPLPEQPSSPDISLRQDQSQVLQPMTSGDTVRISSAKLDLLLLKTEELIAVKQILMQHLDQLKKTNETLRVWKIQSKRTKLQLKELGITADSHGAMQRFYHTVETNNHNLETLSSTLKELSTSLEQNNRMLGGMVDELLEEVKNTSLLPFSSLFAILPRMVRDIARAQGKDIEIEISGNDIEIDKRILERMKDPIIHLIRNSVDHGIEAPEKRKLSNKQPWGTIRIAATQPEGHKVEMIIEDDGAGINVESVKTLAVKKGIISSDHADLMDDTEAIGLIFQSGVSTSPIITEISGRGLGMAIVKETIESLGGHISVINKPKQGATFLITLPVTIATFRGILVSASGQLFILPNSQVEHILKLKPSDIRTAENRTIVSLNGAAVSLVRLEDLLGLPRREDFGKKKIKQQYSSLPAVVLTNGDVRIAVIVDTIVNEQEVLVKNLGRQIRQIPNISGATILGTGRVVPILNVKSLIKTASGKGQPLLTDDSITHQKPEPVKSILIVEDSFTSRTLLKNILEASGYSVKTAIDGEDGYNQLKSNVFDAVVSDVQMPKMDGFKLTQKIRADKDFSEMPVVLVTSLDSPADKEKGIDVGANAYIVKSNFDQSNLLEVLERLT